MFQAIPYITSGLTLAAFVAAVVASVLRQKMLARQKLIELAPPDERPELV